MEPDDPGVLYNVSCVYVRMGKIEEALHLLEQGARVGLPGREWLEHDSDLAPLRNDPRYQAIIESLPRRQTPS